MACSDAIVVFAITAGFDVALNVLPPPLGATTIRGYFERHTVLSAALIAGLVGAVTFAAIVRLFPDAVRPSAMACLKVFLVSALIGFPMQWSRLFPHLDDHYYRKVPRVQSFIADGTSGVMVACVYWIVKAFARSGNGGPPRRG